MSNVARRTKQAAAWPAMVALALIAACSANEPAAAARPVLALQVSPTPARVGDAKLALRLTDEYGEPVHVATLQVEATMSHAGMTPEFAGATEVGPGRYEAELELTMGGDWVLLVDATTPDGERHHWQHELPNVSSRGR